MEVEAAVDTTDRWPIQAGQGQSGRLREGHLPEEQLRKIRRAVCIEGCIH